MRRWEESDLLEPTEAVTRAFGVGGAAERFESGEGQAFRVGELVLKPAAEAHEAEWVGSVLENVVERGFRVARPVRASTGSFVHEGWTASRWVAGHATDRDWDAVIRSGERFHTAIRGVAPPDFLQTRAHQWAIGDRVAFGDEQVELARPVSELVERLCAHVGHLELASQVVHGDLTQNVLLADGAPPAIIDFSPYYRPPGFASAVVAVDAVVWFAAPLGVVDLVEPASARSELLARALIFRLVAAALHAVGDPTRLRIQADAHAPLVDRVIHALDGRREPERY